jgi:hypothetical protein
VVAPPATLENKLSASVKKRGSNRVAWVLGLGLFALLGVLVDAVRTSDRRAARDLAGRLQLTDLALFNEARYARHLSQADRHAAFQDHPMALEHFPVGTLALPPLDDARLD